MDILALVQTSNFTCTKLNVNEDSFLFKLIFIEFSKSEVRRLKRALPATRVERFFTKSHSLYLNCFVNSTQLIKSKRTHRQCFQTFQRRRR